MTRNTFEILYNKLKPTFKNCYLGRSKKYSLKYGLYMTIWKLANRNSFREISDRFGVAQGSAYRIFIKCVTLIANLKSKVIRFPRTATSQRKLIEEFEKIRCRPFPNTIGCIDGMHISISKPLKDPISFYNRKGFYSILVQLLVASFNNKYAGTKLFQILLASSLITN
ncbi:putative nuclease HARBI1 [Condylostylus longicornis]|uniref:putative nuclease HARBI1 n=1 Tax=Condylostylus longicornis TaxID=2530218 RepID=UPI00244E2789|nr:putative nuclease HARBI1 [Condylostylus longicornis]